MSYIIGAVPYFRCLLRKEYTRNLKDGHGEYMEAVVVGARCQRGLSLYFQTWIQSGNNARAAFLAPIEALVTKPCEPKPTAWVQPWDVFSPDFGVTRFDLWHRSRCWVLRGREKLPARHQMTFDFTGNELSDDLTQHKHLHLVFHDSGHIGAYPNNRVLFDDPAFIEEPLDAFAPDIRSLEGEFYAE